MRRLAASMVTALVMTVLMLAPTFAQADPGSTQAGAGQPAPSQEAWRSSKTLAEVSAICVRALRLAAAEAAAAEEAEEEDEGNKPNLALAIKSCASLDEWVTASTAYPDALWGADPLEVAVSMCADGSLGLDAYTLCHDVRTSLIGGSGAGGVSGAALRAACQAGAADQGAFEACLRTMSLILATDSATEAYLVVAAADGEAREVARAMLDAARDDAARTKAWAASAARNEAFIATVAALGLPAEARAQVDKLISRSRLVASLEHMLSRRPRDRGRSASWKAAVEARRKAALELRRVLGIPITRPELSEEAPGIDVDLLFRSKGLRERVQRHIPTGQLTWCDWGIDTERGGGPYVRSVVIGDDDLGVDSLTSFSFEDLDGPGRPDSNVFLDVKAGLASGQYAWDPDLVLGTRPKGKVRHGESDRRVRLDIKAVKILQPARRMVVKGTITCEAPHR